jgi:hypothetical protein
MIFKRSDIVAGILVGLGVTGMGLAFGQTPSVARRSTPTASRPGAAGLPPAANLIYKYVKTEIPGELRWQQIPWLIDLPEAIKVARTEDRPLLLWVSGDDPLERC